MATSQTKLVTPIDKKDPRTPWQKVEYERRRTSYRKEFKNLCLKHLNFLKHKESIIDFEHLLIAWQLALQYHYSENKALLQQVLNDLFSLTLPQQQQLEIVASQLFKAEYQPAAIAQSVKILQEYARIIATQTTSNLELLANKLKSAQQDLKSLQYKYEFLVDCLLKFNKAAKDDPALLEQDFCDVLEKDDPQVLADKSILSELADQIRETMLRQSHRLQLHEAIQYTNLHCYELGVIVDKLILAKQDLMQEQITWQEFLAYLQQYNGDSGAGEELLTLRAKFTNMQQVQVTNADKFAKYLETVELAADDFTKNNFKLIILELQEKLELQWYSYRAWRHQEVFFKRNFRRSQIDDPEVRAQWLRKLIEFKEIKEQRHQAVFAEFATPKQELLEILAHSKTSDQIAQLKAAHLKQYPLEFKEIMISYPADFVLPLPITPEISYFNFADLRNALIVATAQVVGESLSRLVIAASVRPKPKPPQEHAGLLNVDEAASNEMADLREKEDQATAALGTSRTAIRKLGEELNQLIKGLE